jgi:hypothetical protein
MEWILAAVAGDCKRGEEAGCFRATNANHGGMSGKPEYLTDWTLNHLLITADL